MFVVQFNFFATSKKNILVDLFLFLEFNILNHIYTATTTTIN